MVTQKKINTLKKMAIKSADSIRESFQVNDFSYVSNSGLTYSDITEKIDKIYSCASIIELKSNFVKSNDGSLEQVMSISAANYCKQHTICPICADRSQARRRARFDESIREQVKKVEETNIRKKTGLYKENDIENRFAYMITKTVRDGSVLSDRLSHLKESNKKFRLMGQRRGKDKKSLGESGKIVAALSTVEIKRGRDSGQWHAHLHELVFSDRPLDYVVYDKKQLNSLKNKYGENIPAELLKTAVIRSINIDGKSVPVSKISHEWYRSSGDSTSIEVSPLRHIPRNSSGRKKRLYRKMSFVDSVVYQAKECLKYPTKPSDYLPTDAIEIIDSTYNKRLTNSYGRFRGIGGDDYVDAPDLDDDTFVLIWDNESKKYGDPVPGTIRDYTMDYAHSARSDSAKITGDYRRRRRSMLAMRSEAGESLSVMLDSLKRSYRAQICARWSLFRQQISQMRRSIGVCDKYSPLLSLAGRWLPGSDSRDVYSAVFG